jgi:5-methylthioadenosine/S-adenosylhomocysteine deaminase
MTRDQWERLSRRGVLGMGVAGIAGAATPAFARDGAGHRGHSRRLLVRGGTVLSMDPSVGDFMQGDVLVKNGKIEAVGPQLSAPGAYVIDARGKIVMPGFVDTHRHMWQGLIRNSGPNAQLLDYLNTVLFGFAPVITPDEVYTGNLVTALSAANAGITTMLDWSHIATSPEHSDAAIGGLAEAGVRAVYAYGPNFGKQPPWFEDLDNPYPGDIYRLAEEYFSSTDQLLTLALAAAGPEFSNVDAAEIEWNVARDVGVPITTHVGVGAPGSSGLLAQLAGRVGLGPDTTYIHACTLTDLEFQMIADSGGKLSLAVPVEMQMGHGMPPIQRSLDFGIRPSLSVDVETNQPTDMFTQMRACFALQRGLLNAENLFPETAHVPQLLTARDVLEFATIEGARTNGLGNKVGSLTPGKDADFILLNARALNVAPMNDPVGAVVLGMDTSNVEAVFVAGRPLKWQGAMVGVDVEALLDRAEAMRLALYERAGLPLPGV